MLTMFTKGDSRIKMKTMKKRASNSLNNIITMIPYLDEEQKLTVERTLQPMLVDVIRKLQLEKELHSTAN